MSSETIGELQGTVLEQAREDHRRDMALIEQWKSVRCWQILHVWRGGEGWEEVIKRKHYHLLRGRYLRALDKLRSIMGGTILHEALLRLKGKLFSFWKETTSMMMETRRGDTSWAIAIQCCATRLTPPPEEEVTRAAGIERALERLREVGTVMSQWPAGGDKIGLLLQQAETGRNVPEYRGPRWLL
jgi:hypothetical protein